jgi:hypothetical protein
MSESAKNIMGLVEAAAKLAAAGVSLWLASRQIKKI